MRLVSVSSFSHSPKELLSSPQTLGSIWFSGQPLNLFQDSIWFGPQHFIFAQGSALFNPQTLNLIEGCRSGAMDLLVLVQPQLLIRI
jgi:hypothetical protein